MRCYYHFVFYVVYCKCPCLQFKKVQEAFEILQNKLQEEEQSKLYHDIHYVASIEKGPKGVGFGMVVVEDTKKGHIIAKVCVNNESQILFVVVMP